MWEPCHSEDVYSTCKIYGKIVPFLIRYAFILLSNGIKLSLYIDKGTRRDPYADTGGRWLSSDIYYTKRGRQKAGRGQARVHKPGQSTRGQAVLRSGQAGVQ